MIQMGRGGKRVCFQVPGRKRKTIIFEVGAEQWPPPHTPVLES